LKILIFGKNGQVSTELLQVFADASRERLVVRGSDQADFKNPEKLPALIREIKPTHIINAAAYTAVDKAESEEAIANTINGEAVGVIATEAKKIGAKLIHYSTDYVFDGTKKTPYVESDVPNPLNAYGRSKLLGEKNIQQVGGEYHILRVSWVYGQHGNNFYKTMLKLAADREELRVVSDQIGAPTWSRTIAEKTKLLVQSANLSSGIYHVSPQGQTSWYDFACKIFETARAHGANLKIKTVTPIPSSDYPTPAKRPLNSKMISEKELGPIAMEKTWDQYLKDIYV
jgi:dTDP-4-dehydrorhamnose reductase